MLESMREDPTARIAAVVGGVLAKHGVVSPVPAEADIGRYGMTSIDMVELMLGVEAEFDVAIPPSEIVLANFNSISAIENLLARLKAAH